MQKKEQDAIAYMVSHPAHEIELLSGRFVSLWAGGTPSPIRDFWRSRSLWFRYVLLFNLAAAIGAVAGLWRLFREGSPVAFPLAVYPLVFPWAYYLTLSLPRYRHPIDPILLLLTVAAFTGSHTCAPVARD
jgi:hypothetical protein